MTFAILIPAYKPTLDLVSLVGSLRTKTDARIMIVDDGSGQHFQPIFNELAKLSHVFVLHHSVNLGKGAALKTGMNHIHWSWPEIASLITADADGQHHPDDILAVANRCKVEPSHLIMGVRGFSGDIPLRSKIGNRLTVVMVRLFAGIKLSDTQTGLRGIPRALVPGLLRMRAMGYEFELDMLLLAKKTQVSIGEVPIQTIYIDGNRSSHFSPFKDSLKIYSVLCPKFVRRQ
jgi:glycosyltransferase involved in cell wall biosynthesis